MNLDLSGEPRKKAILTENIERERALETEADQVTLEMSRYIDLGLYHAVERSHPFYIEMVDYMCNLVRNLADRPHAEPVRILEIGAGTGLFTESLLAIENVRIDALELDQECVKLLKSHLQDHRLNTVQGDAVLFNYAHTPAHTPYDVIVSCFAHDHIHYDRAEAFAKNIRKNLKTGGHYIMGGEILPAYKTNEERWEALHRYHGFIIEMALREGHYALAQIEINALKSGIEMEGDFKRHEDLFEKEILAEAFRMNEKVKIGPSHRDDLGGVYVYDFIGV